MSCAWFFSLFNSSSIMKMNIFHTQWSQRNFNISSLLWTNELSSFSLFDNCSVLKQFFLMVWNKLFSLLFLFLNVNFLLNINTSTRMFLVFVVAILTVEGVFMQDNLSFPLICPDWNADDEILLLEVSTSLHIVFHAES